jgi:hypothetical protein
MKFLRIVEGRNMLWLDPKSNEIFVLWDGRGATTKSRVRIYANVAKARENDFAPCGSVFGEKAVAELGLEGHADEHEDVSLEKSDDER